MRREYDFSKGKRGPVLPEPTSKTRITIRIDDDVLDWFRERADAAGGSYQTLINRVLRGHVQSGDESLEDMIRRVLREELPRRKGKPDR